MTTQHTPGPWDLNILNSPFPDGKTQFWVTTTKNIQKCFVATWEEFDGYSLRQMKADAQLIAAAPDLLAALKTARRFVVSSHKPSNVELNEIDAAIAKAEGK